MTTEELIAEIERLDAAATAGPWRVDGTIRRDGKGRPNLPAYIEVELSAEDSATIIEVWDKDEDAELIASYRTLAVEAARKLREKNEYLTAFEERLTALSKEHAMLQSQVGNPDWHRQMASSLDFFENGGEGKSLADLGRELANS